MGILGSHFVQMCIFAAVVAAVVSTIDPERHTVRQRLLYGARVFGAFVGIGLALGWLMRFVPF